MYCYKDMTFCDFKDCAKHKGCFRELTKKIEREAEKFGAPISRFGSKPECFDEPPMQIKGKIEIRPISKKGNVIFICERSFLYPENKHILEESYDQLLDRCFVDGADGYHIRAHVHSIRVVIVPEPIMVKDVKYEKD